MLVLAIHRIRELPEIVPPARARLQIFKVHSPLQNLVVDLLLILQVEDETADPRALLLNHGA